MRESTPHRQNLWAGYRVWSRTAGVGLVATAEVAEAADHVITERERPEPRETDYPLYRMSVVHVRWLPEPVSLDESLRSQLDVFLGVVLVGTADMVHPDAAPRFGTGLRAAHGSGDAERGVTLTGHDRHDTWRQR